VEGRNITLEFRHADGRPERLPALAAELVQAQLDVIVTNAAQSIDALRAATSTIPIVMASVGDALGAGYVASLAHPGGNVTGLTLFATEQSGKRLELVKEMSPNVVRVTVIWNGNASGHRLQMKELEPAASKLGLVLQSIPILRPGEIEGAFEAAKQASAQAIVTMDDPMIQLRRVQIVELAIKQRIILMGEFRAMPVAGARDHERHLRERRKQHVRQHLDHVGADAAGRGGGLEPRLQHAERIALVERAPLLPEASDAGVRRGRQITAIERAGVEVDGRRLAVTIYNEGRRDWKHRSRMCLGGSGPREVRRSKSFLTHLLATL
jgi:hypothetical protein